MMKKLEAKLGKGASMETDDKKDDGAVVHEEEGTGNRAVMETMIGMNAAEDSFEYEIYESKNFKE